MTVITRPPSNDARQRTRTERTARAAIVIGGIALLGFSLLAMAAPVTTLAWNVSGKQTFVTLPAAELSPAATGTVMAVLVLLGAAILWRSPLSPALRRAVYASAPIALSFGLLVLLGSGSEVSLPAFVSDVIGRSAPLVLAVLGAVLCERAGVVNVAIEGQLLLSAFSAALVSSLTGSGWVGVIAGVLSSVLVAAVLATLAIRFLADQLIVGIVINVAVSGLTAFLVSSLINANPALSASKVLPNLDFGGLSQIPILGPIAFGMGPFSLMAIIAGVIVICVFRYTKVGLHISAVGENPRAADSVGLNVRRIRFWAVLAGGAIIGLGGAYFTVGSVGNFTEDMVGGRGFIALAALILGNWNPRGAIVAAVLFGTADAFQSLLSLLGTPLPSALLLTIPYLVTIVAIVLMRGRIHPPSADGVPYQRA